MTPEKCQYHNKYDYDPMTGTGGIYSSLFHNHADNGTKFTTVFNGNGMTFEKINTGVINISPGTVDINTFDFKNNFITQYAINVASVNSELTISLGVLVGVFRYGTTMYLFTKPPFAWTAKDYFNGYNASGAGGETFGMMKYPNVEERMPVNTWQVITFSRTGNRLKILVNGITIGNILFSYYALYAEGVRFIMQVNTNTGTIFTMKDIYHVSLGQEYDCEGPGISDLLQAI